MDNGKNTNPPDALFEEQGAVKNSNSAVSGIGMIDLGEAEKIAREDISLKVDKTLFEDVFDLKNIEKNYKSTVKPAYPDKRKKIVKKKFIPVQGKKKNIIKSFIAKPAQSRAENHNKIETQAIKTFEKRIDKSKELLVGKKNTPIVKPKYVNSSEIKIDLDYVGDIDNSSNAAEQKKTYDNGKAAINSADESDADVKKSMDKLLNDGKKVIKAIDENEEQEDKIEEEYVDVDDDEAYEYYEEIIEEELVEDELIEEEPIVDQGRWVPLHQIISAGKSNEPQKVNIIKDHDKTEWIPLEAAFSQSSADVLSTKEDHQEIRVRIQKEADILDRPFLVIESKGGSLKQSAKDYAEYEKSERNDAVNFSNEQKSEVKPETKNEKDVMEFVLVLDDLFGGVQDESKINNDPDESDAALNMPESELERSLSKPVYDHDAIWLDFNDGISVSTRHSVVKTARTAAVNGLLRKNSLTPVKASPSNSSRDDARKQYDEDLDLIHFSLIEDDYRQYIKEIDEFYGSRTGRGISSAVEILGLTSSEMDFIEDSLYKRDFENLNLTDIYDYFGHEYKGQVKKTAISRNCAYMLPREDSLFDDEKRSIEIDLSAANAFIYEEDVEEIIIQYNRIIDKKALAHDKAVKEVQPIKIEPVIEEKIIVNEDDYPQPEPQSEKKIERLIEEPIADITNNIVFVDDENEDCGYVDGIPAEKQGDIKILLKYLDGLFDKLPDNTVKNFARSDYFNLYLKVLQELGV
jgi:hypothetical protein